MSILSKVKLDDDVEIEERKGMKEAAQPLGEEMEAMREKMRLNQEKAAKAAKAAVKKRKGRKGKGRKRSDKETSSQERKEIIMNYFYSNQKDIIDLT